jgi:hypothetical protein
MRCKRCGQRAELDPGGICAECAQARVNSGVVKSSTIVVSSGETTAVYRSIKEIPVEVRRRLRRATNGGNSGTILIADRRGRDEIARAMRKLPSFKTVRQTQRSWTPRVQQAVALLLIVLTLILIWLVFTRRF